MKCKRVEGFGYVFGFRAIHSSACPNTREARHGIRAGLAVLWLVTVLLVAGCRAATARDSLPLTTASVPTLVPLTPGEQSPCQRPTLQAISSPVHAPGPTPYALFAVTQYAHTTVVALSARGPVSLTEPQAVGEIRLSSAGRALAYEALAGINPLGNVVVVADLATGAAWQVAPGEGCALSGFTLDSSGDRLALLQVAMRGRFKPAPWQVSVVDLASGQSSTLGPAQPQEVAFEPVAWSRATDEIVLRAFVPFQVDGAAGLWAVRPDGSHLRRLLHETDYVGGPQLSPDGRLLAFFASEPDNLPEEYVASPGEPPANALRVLDLLAGETHTLAVDPARAFDALAWDAEGERLYLTRGAWQGAERGFEFDEIVSLSVNHSRPEVLTRTPESVVGLRPCSGGGLAYVTAGERGAVVHWDGQEAARRAEWVVQNGAVEILACLLDE